MLSEEKLLTENQDVDMITDKEEMLEKIDCRDLSGNVSLPADDGVTNICEQRQSSDALSDHVITEPSCLIADNENSEETEQTTKGTQSDVDILKELQVTIDNLPDNYPEALTTIREEIAPKLLDCSKGIKDYCVAVIKKKTNAATVTAVRAEIENVKKPPQPPIVLAKRQVVKTVDPAVLQMAMDIAHDPQLFKRRIDTVGLLGTVGERRTTGMNFVGLDSRLLPLRNRSSEALAVKTEGPPGVGKSDTLFNGLEIYPEEKYHVLSTATPMSLFYIPDGLKHKSIIITEACSFQLNNKADSEFTYLIRILGLTQK